MTDDPTSPWLLDNDPEIRSSRPILLVDDVPANLTALEAALAPLGRTLIRAVSGPEALRQLLQHDCCLALLDLQMPGMNGFDTATMIRARPRTRFMPIIFVTANEPNSELVLQGYRLGAVDFLFKPLNAEILLAKSRFFVALQDQAEALAAERAARVSEEAAKIREQAKQAQLERLNGILAENDRRKNAFLAILGHELRNPLAPIRTALDLAKGGTLTPRLINVIDRQSATLMRLVDDLLDVARINSQRFELRTAVHDLRSIIDDAVAGCSLEVERAGHELHLSVPPRRVPVQADRVRIMQVIMNLINNACRYTPAGGRIDVECTIAAREAVIRVRDNGRGISPDLLPSMFDMFVRERVRRDGSGGLGLGLALSRQLVDLHRGRIRALSDGPGKGACFEVMLPADESIKLDVVPSMTTPSTTRKLRAVIVDDNEDARELLADVLRQHGHAVMTAATGLDGLSLIEHEVPDVALVDLGLPDLDGVSLAQRLRDRHPGLATRLIAVTGFGQEHDRVRTSDAGFRAHLVKPTHIEAILAALDEATAD
jgi:signal transduction histidine kinase